MKASLRALLTGVIDYAGLFPPAKLPLDEAIRNYAQYRTEPESWMLGRFICPAARTAELVALGKGHWDHNLSGTALTALGRGGQTSGEYLDGLRLDAEDLIKSCPHGLMAYETTLPKSIADVGELTRLMTATADTLGGMKPYALSSYFEIPGGENWRDAVRSAAEAVVRTGEYVFADGMSHTVGLKLRCGGLEPSAFPGVEDVAYFLLTCKQAGGVFAKFTAGLHHPFRHFNEGVQTRMHGFLNVLCAAVFLYDCSLDGDQVYEMLADEVPEHFAFTEGEIAWRDWKVPVRGIPAVRQRYVGSFGSCSFDEPRDDLRALGLL